MLINAFARFICDIPNAKLMFVGDGPEHDNLLSLAKTSCVDGNVVFTGYHENITELL